MRQVPKPALARCLSAVALVAGGFCITIWLLLLVHHFASKKEDPMNTPRLAVLKEKLREAPQDEQLKTEIRSLDLQLRRKYFRYLSLTSAGAWLLLGGGIGFLLAAKAIHPLRAVPFLPQPRGAERSIDRTNRLSRWSIAGAGGLTLAGLVALATGARSNLPERAGDLEKLLGTPGAAVTAPPDLPAAHEFLSSWPQLRGPTASGVCLISNVPLTLHADSIAWKSEVPIHGFNSPIVWGNRVFLSGGDANQREVMCFSAEDGRELWRETVRVPGNTNEPPRIPEMTGYAASTMATDGRRVYAIFGNNDLAAFTLEGQSVWSTNFGPAKNHYGHAASLVTWQGRVIVQLDQGDEGERLSRIYAIDGQTGRVVWQRARPVAQSWSTPLVLDGSGKAQIVTLGLPWVITYAAADGAELWRAEILAGEITPSPAFGAGLVFAVGPSEKLFALRPNGQGDVSKTHIAWTAEDNLPDITSPAANDELALILSSGGVLTCFDASSGKPHWEHDFQAEFFASPVIVPGGIYLCSKPGTVIVIEAGPQFRELARVDLGEEISATPAFAPGRVFVRGAEHLFCLTAAATAVAKP